MDTIKQNYLLIAIVVLVVLGTGVFLFFGTSSTPSSTNQNATSTPTSEVTGVNPNGFAPTTSSGGTGTVKNPVLPVSGDANKYPTPGYPTPKNVQVPVQPVVSFVSPISGAKWVIGQAHTIKWNTAANVPGGIYLVSAATNQTVGWILPGAAQTQTSYDWNTTDISITRTGGSKKDIDAGDYYIKLTFDGKLSEVQSSKISIIQATQASIPSYNVTIANYAFAPNTITVNHGDRVVFRNNDPVEHRVLSTGFGPYDLPSGQSYTLDTTNLRPGSYTYYCDLHPQMLPGTLIIK